MKTKKIIKKLRQGVEIARKRIDEGAAELSTMAASRLEMLSVQLKNLNARLRTMLAEQETMAAALKKSGGCGNCKHCSVEYDQDPCDSCRQDPSFPKWEWKGE